MYCYAECHYAECHYAEYRYAECRYAECRGAKLYQSLAFLSSLISKVFITTCLLKKCDNKFFRTKQKSFIRPVPALIYGRCLGLFLSREGWHPF
jgi:hypothetical protein